MSQSSNDTFPRQYAAAAEEIDQHLIPMLTKLQDGNQSEEFKDIVKIGRYPPDGCCTPDAGTRIFRLCNATRSNLERIQYCHLYELAIGGTAVGTGLNHIQSCGAGCR